MRASFDLQFAVTLIGGSTRKLEKAIEPFINWTMQKIGMK